MAKPRSMHQYADTSECTQGPWRVTSLHFVRTADGRPVAGVYGNREDCREDQCMRDRARLIAAAPDLLAALEGIERWWLEVGMKDATGAPYEIFAARAAIRLAKPASTNEEAV